MKALADSVFLEKLPWFKNEEVPESNYRNLIEKMAVHSNLVALLAEEDQGHEVVGLLQCTPRKTHSSEFVIMVRAENRGSGVGSALLHALLKWACTQPELKRLEAQILESNTPSQKLLKKYGFVVLSRKPIFVTVHSQQIREDIFYLELNS